MLTTVKRAAAIAVLLVFPIGLLGADDTGDRDRKARVALALAQGTDSCRDRDARVALALAESRQPITTAPAPRKSAPLCPCCDDCKCPGGCPCAGGKSTKGDDLSKVRDALVRVRCGSAQGSGTVIWSDGSRSVVLTAAHVVAGGGELSVRGEGKTYPAQLLGRDDTADLAALVVSAKLPAVRVAIADPADGADVLLVGMTSLWSKGKIDRREEWRGGETYLLGAGYESDSGDSGGGVFVGADLVGVHCGKVGANRDSVNTPYAVGAKPIRTFLARLFKRSGSVTVLIDVPAPAIARTPAQPTVPSNCPGGVCPLPSFSLPSYPSGGCPGGQCPAPSSSTRRGIFRR